MWAPICMGCGTPTASGNFVSAPLSNVSGTSAALESMELSFNHDLNGDGTIGIPVPSSATVIESSGTTNLLASGNTYLIQVGSRRRGSADLWRAAGGGRRIWRHDSDRGAADGERI